MPAATASTERIQTDPRLEFPATRWTWLGDLVSPDEAKAAAALSDLCKAYWEPLFTYVRMSGLSPEDAQDATQDFFQAVLANEILKRACRMRGHLRSFLLTSMKNHLANRRRNTLRLRRGGEIDTVPLDALPFEGEAFHAHGGTPEQMYDRKWVIALLNRVLSEMQRGYVTEGKAEWFTVLRPYLLDDEGSPEGYRSEAAALGLSPGAVKVAVHRLRHRFRQRLVEEVAATVGGEDEVAGELEALMSIFSTSGH